MRSTRVLALAIPLTACSTIAIATTPDKQPIEDRSPPAESADRLFWATLHGGHYDQIDGALEQLQRAYLAHPNDPRTTAHIGFLHIWRVAESARLDQTLATITENIVLARHYFEEASQLAPDDARFLGFWAGMMLAEGKTHGDERLTRKGFYAMNDAVAAWPEFNLFTRGYVMSALPYDDSRYASAVDDQWKNLDVCTDGATVDRTSGDFAPYMKLETHAGTKRACWDSWIAPHNFEGFFLNMGDMLVKQGDWQVAQRVYAQARLAKGYESWKYRAVLERRIANASTNVSLFRRPDSDRENRVMFKTAFACMACHEQ